MTQALKKVEQQEVTVFGVTAKALEDLHKKYEPVKAIANKKDYETVRLGIGELRALRAGIDKKRLELNADDQARIKSRNGEAKLIIEELREIEEPLKALKNAEDERIAAEKKAKADAEAERVAAIRSKIDLHFGNTRIFDLMNSPSLYIQGRIEEIEAVTIDDEGYAEFAGEAEMQKTAILIQVRKRLEDRILEEETDKQRTEERRLQEIEAERIKVQQTEIAKQMAVIEKENARIAEENRLIEQAKADAASAAQKVRDDAAAAEQKRVDDEAARLQAIKDEKAQAERDRIAAEEQAKADAAELKRQESLKPDKEKLTDLANTMDAWLAALPSMDNQLSGHASAALVDGVLLAMRRAIVDFRNGIERL